MFSNLAETLHRPKFEVSDYKNKESVQLSMCPPEGLEDKYSFQILTFWKLMITIYFTLPETQGKTLTQLENIYVKERKDD